MLVPTELAALLGGRYRGLTSVGKGTQGQVFRGLDSECDDAPVAIKWVASEACRRGAIQEFSHLASVAHPGLSRIQGIRESANGICLISSFVDGIPLADHLRASPAEGLGALLLDLAASLSLALGHLHAQDLAHGDIKPENMLCPTKGEQLVVLLDLGLARSMGPGDCRGTPAYMAPEALTGHQDALTDLYSLGMSLIEVASCERVIDAAQPDLVSAILAGSSVRARSLLGDLPQPLADLLVSMISVDRSKRPSGMGGLRAHIARVAEACGIDLAPSGQLSPNFIASEFFGRHSEVQWLQDILSRHADADLSSSLCEVAGISGSGRTRIIREAILRAQVELSRSEHPGLSILPLHLPGAWPSSAPNATAFLEEHARHLPGQVVMVCEESDAQTLEELLAAACPKRVLLLVERPVNALLGAQAIQLSPLSTAECAGLCNSLATRPVPRDWSKRAGELAHGQPGPLLDIMRAANSLDPLYRGSPDALFQDEDLSASLLAQVRGLSRMAGRLLELLAVAQSPVSWGAAALQLGATALAKPAQELIAAGLMVPANGEMQCASLWHARVIDAHLPEARRKALHRKVLADNSSLPLQRRTRHLLVAGPASAAAASSLDAIREARREGRLCLALELCRASASVVRGRQASEHAVEMAEVALITGEYELAQEFAAKARRSRTHELRSRGMRALASCARHRGDLQAATALLRELVAIDSENSVARSALAKSLLAEGELAESLIEADAASKLASSPREQFAAAETSGLAHLYTGNTQASAADFARLQLFAGEAEDNRLRGRAMGLAAMVEQKQSHLCEAAELYASAADFSFTSGASHAGAVFLMNRATVLERLARYSEALACYEVAHDGLLRGGTPFELCATHCNRGNLLLTLGELESARRQAEAAHALAERAPEPRISFFVHLLRGEVCQREGVAALPEESRLHFERALALASEHGLSDGVYAAIRLAEGVAESDAGDAAQYVELLISDSEEHQGEVLACRTRVALALRSPTPALALELADALEDAIAKDGLDLAWKLASLHARTLAALGEDDLEGAARMAAGKLFAKVLDSCPEAYRDGLRRHPDAEALASLDAQKLPRRETPSRASEGLPLRRLLALSRRLNSEQRIEPLLDEIIDTAIELSRAERGFLLLRDSSGELQFRVARNMGREELDAREELSTSIAERVASTGQVVMTVDAEADQRFGASLSVAALQLRSILAVPFRVKQRIHGTLYLDHRFRRSAFDDDAVEVVRELADIAAVAIENARLSRENLRKQGEIRELNLQLEERLQSTEVELQQTRARIAPARPGGAFEGIVGQSKPMRDLLVVAERAAGCALSVVIFGESGTGKELLARAIHDGSSRCGGAFVPINCGAVPDNLLEAELFGYLRGAYTGADRGKRGLFEVADGGTLFLDEIADTSLSMQSKLLRALQEGEIRPLGAEQLRHVDIRVVCASNKDLWEEVLAGRFREDLYYRLKVLEMRIPALRERREDIPLLASHLLRRLCPGSVLSPSALRRLRAHEWPGNVRELENELARASAMTSETEIHATHFSEAVQVLPSKDHDKAPEGFEIRPQVEALERRLVEAAMRETNNNQSKAAILLGLSRYGLQKKLQRYGIVGSLPTAGKTTEAKAWQ
ncbi:MAG: GAF domain-containing protein [Myxococcales bacterium]|nr:GAF domain-containing protein [Myxococcales bacterium]